MSASRQAALDEAIAATGCDFSGEIRIGGDYLPVVVDEGLAWVSGQVPRVGTTVMVTGRAGADATLQEAQAAARICTIRALLLLKQALGSLDALERIARVGVFVQSAPDFTQQSEVADAASALLRQVLGEAGRHARTSVGVYQLPKNATVEVELVARVRAQA